MRMDLNNIIKKAKFMTVTMFYNENEYTELGTYNFEIVEDYTYLGTFLTNKNQLWSETEKELQTQIEHIICTSSSTKQSTSIQSRKLKICKTLIQPVATHGAESWTSKESFKKNVWRN